MLMRVADQAYAGFKAALFYAHLSVASYGLMLLYIEYVDQRPVFDLATLSKILCIYAGNLYLSFATRAVGILRRSTRSAVHLARECITHLEEQAQQLHEHATQLTIAKRDAEEANHSKSVFLTNMSHELLTPLNGIMGMTALTLETPLTAQQQTYLATVQMSATTLLQLIHTLLDFASLDAGQRVPASEPFALRPQVAIELERHRAAAHAKGLTLSCTVAPDVPECVVGDAACLQQVLALLLDNAIKFTPRGSVTTTVTVGQDEAKALLLRVAVRDTGIGIAPEQQHLIFGPFKQGDDSTTRRYGGTGLGLALAAKLVALLGGTLGVESQTGHGSTFSFTARLGRSDAAPLGATTRPSDLDTARP